MAVLMKRRNGAPAKTWLVCSRVMSKSQVCRKRWQAFADMSAEGGGAADTQPGNIGIAA
jgi:hypothetical protein